MKSFFMKLIEKAEKISKNKYVNFALGMILFILLYVGLKPIFIQNLCIAKGISLFFVFLISYIKEYTIREKWFGKKVEPLDPFIMDLGGFVGVIFTFFLV